MGNVVSVLCSSVTAFDYLKENLICIWKIYAYYSYFSKCKPYLNTVRDSNAGKKVFDLKLFCFENIFVFLKIGFLMKMADISVRDILSCEEFQIVLIRSYEIDPFIMGYHVYKADWTPFVGEKLTGVMGINKLDG